MAEISTHLRRSVEKAEREGDGKKITLHKQQDIEAKASIEIAEKQGVWIDDTNKLGHPFSSGHENNNYLDKEGKFVYKANNLANSQTITRLFESVSMHNELFPDTAYEFAWFTGDKNRLTSIQPVFKQKLIHDSVEAEPRQIKAYMEALGFKQTTPESYVNDQYLVYDLFPRNVLKDKNGDIYVVDAEIKKIEQPAKAQNESNNTDVLFQKEPIKNTAKRLREKHNKLHDYKNELISTIKNRLTASSFGELTKSQVTTILRRINNAKTFNAVDKLTDKIDLTVSKAEHKAVTKQLVSMLKKHKKFLKSVNGKHKGNIVDNQTRLLFNKVAKSFFKGTETLKNELESLQAKIEDGDTSEKTLRNVLP